MLTLFLRSAQHRRVATAEFEPTGEAPILEIADATPSVLTGVGPTFEKPIMLDIPEGSNSFHIEFDCEGLGEFTVQFGEMWEATAGSHRGECSTSSDFVWPITESFRSALRIFVHDDASWTLRPSFSPMAFVSDQVIGADCAAFIPVVSALSNADHGYRYDNAVDEDEWRERITLATAELDALVSSADSELKDAFTEVRVTLGTDVGMALDGAYDAITTVHTACSRNHTAVYYVSEFGG
jgi:hypothetical protein